ncbi:MAG TPA: sigma-70 family RNA polymerase sigma factor [Bryobacteraceae bacterium]|nr:sigma-70 family RNA polymerase sigma factor [Bryobacteraceae bacterium]
MAHQVPACRGLYRTAQECPEALTDEEVMLVLCDSSADLGNRLFSEIFRRYHVRVTAWCFRLTRNRGRALDLAQEIFFKAYRHRHGFRGDSRFSTWLYVITRNHCLSSLKKLADPVEMGETVPLRLQDCSVPRPDVLMERRQRQKEMWEMIGAVLEPMEARVMALHYGYELPLAAITRQLALTNPSGAKAYIVNARRKLNVMIKRRALRESAAPLSRTAA